MKFSQFGKSAICPHCGGSGKTVDYTDVGRWMKGYRERASMTLREVSTKTGYSISYISDLEHGRRAWNGTRFEVIKQAIDK